MKGPAAPATPVLHPTPPIPTRHGELGLQEPTFVPRAEWDGSVYTTVLSSVARHPELHEMTPGGTEAQEDGTGKSLSLFNGP